MNTEQAAKRCWRIGCPSPGVSSQWVTAQMRLYPQIAPHGTGLTVVCSQAHRKTGRAFKRILGRVTRSLNLATRANPVGRGVRLNIRPFAAADILRKRVRPRAPRPHRSPWFRSFARSVAVAAPIEQVVDPHL